MAIPPDAPSAFLIDIQPGQWEGVHEILRKQGASRVDSVGLVIARPAICDCFGSFSVRMR